MKTVNMFLATIGFLILGIGAYGLIVNISIGNADSTGMSIVLPLIVVGSFLFVFPLICLRNESKESSVIGVVRSHKKITVTEIAAKAGVSEVKARKIIYEAIAKGKLNGTIEGDAFIRAEVSASSTTIEREVMVARKVPETCFKCNAALNPQEIEWVGPDSVRCSHCGATLAVTTERI
ncbi:hypothetical protein E4H12_04235 [Candidatus Thorarchaeota archaeon]|nr:hypothetical protein [Candidatus Thorarchaeota archaeon]TFG99015.1 MAG: hypothetical protein E4H12_04235 [Candidatus Thorarchaeota archaeon]